MPQLKTEWACPKCKRETGASTQILANEGRLACPANSNHRWVDTADFYADGAVMEFKVGPAKFPPVEGQTPITIKVPLHLKDSLETRYKDGLSAAVADVLLQMVNGAPLMIGQTDVERLRDRLGKTPENSSDLVGMVYAKICEAEDAKTERDEAVKDLKAYEGVSRGRVVINLGDQYEAAATKARESEPPLPVAVWLQQRVKTALDDQWF
jgi:hypothetical protein